MNNISSQRTVIPLVMLFVLVWGIVAFADEIHLSAASGDLARVKALLKDHSALVNSQDNFGNTPLHMAALLGQKDVVEFLLANKADVNSTNVLGDTPLHSAADRGYKGVAVLLLANNAEVNATNRLGNTPLHFAAASGHKDVAESLLAKKAEVNIKNNSGETPLHWAVLYKHDDVAELLRQHDGNDYPAASPSGKALPTWYVFRIKAFHEVTYSADRSSAVIEGITMKDKEFKVNVAWDSDFRGNHQRCVDEWLKRSKAGFEAGLPYVIAGKVISRDPLTIKPDTVTDKAPNFGAPPENEY